MSLRRSRVLAVLFVVLALVLSLLTHTAEAAIGEARAGGSAFPVEGINLHRGTNHLVVYTWQSTQRVSPANRWGAEAAVVDGVVTAVRDRETTGQSGMPIPVDGVVLSGHGTARLWILANLRIGQAVTYPGGASPIGPSPSTQPSTSTGASTSGTAVLAAASWPISGTNIERQTDALVVYTSAIGPISPANQWGAEVAVVAGQVSEIRDRQNSGAAGIPIPSNGYVLSGHGNARAWLLTQAYVGAVSSLSGASVTPTGTVNPIGTVTPSPAPSPPATSCSAGYVRLTFDDGPDPAVTPQVLDTLRSRGVRATFFVQGFLSQARPDLIRRQVTEGHRVANHTWDHPYLTQLTPTQQRGQFERASDAIIAAGAPRPNEWRPPYEDWNSGVRDIATSLGMSMVLWNYETDSQDWQGGSADDIRNRVVTNAHDGAIVLLHDRFQTTADALLGIIDGLAGKGLCVRP